MSEKMFLLNALLLVLVIISRFDKSYEECVCNTRVRGEYCGSELNRRSSNSDCQSDHMYFCDDNIQGKPPKFLVKCQDESECEQNQFTLSSRARRRNPCLQRMKCRCPTGIGRGPHCGSKLIGEECPPEMLFMCRGSGSRSRRRQSQNGRLDSQGICLDGCANGRCISAVGDDDDDDDRRRDRDRYVEKEDNTDDSDDNNSDKDP